MNEDNRYRRPRWTAGRAAGCAIWPAAVVLFAAPVTRLVLGPRFFEEGYGPLDLLALPVALAAILVAATAASLVVRTAVQLVFGRRTDQAE